MQIHALDAEVGTRRVISTGSIRAAPRAAQRGEPVRAARESRHLARGKVRRGSKSMGHNVDKLCKHKMLRLGLFALDRGLAKCNQEISRDIFVKH